MKKGLYATSLIQAGLIAPTWCRGRLSRGRKVRMAGRVAILLDAVVHPLSGDRIDFGASRVFQMNTRLISQTENMPDTAVRRGTLVHQGWRLGDSATKGLGSKTALVPEDIVPRIKQRGVDLRIGLDIASFALKRLVSLIVLVTGDSDFIPAMKLARREGLRVVLDSLGRGVRPELSVRADRLI